MLMLCLSLTKLSVALFYGRIFSTIRWFKLILWAVGAIIWAYFISMAFTIIFFCDPVPKIWEPELPGKCLNQWNILWGSAWPNLLIDVILLVLPLPLLWKINASIGKKLGISFVFVCGCL